MSVICNNGLTNKKSLKKHKEKEEPLLGSKIETNKKWLKIFGLTNPIASFVRVHLRSNLITLLLEQAEASRCCSALPVDVVVVLLVVEAAVLEGLVPFLVPVTNSIWKKQQHTHTY